MQFVLRISLFALMLAGSTMFSCAGFSQKLNAGLEAEKSYTRQSMEAYRKDPKAFRGNKIVLETCQRRIMSP
jgi:hypothetical protein